MNSISSLCECLLTSLITHLLIVWHHVHDRLSVIWVNAVIFMSSSRTTGLLWCHSRGSDYSVVMQSLSNRKKLSSVLDGEYAAIYTWRDQITSAVLHVGHVHNITHSSAAFLWDQLQLWRAVRESHYMNNLLAGNMQIPDVQIGQLNSEVPCWGSPRTVHSRWSHVKFTMAPLQYSCSSSTSQCT